MIEAFICTPLRTAIGSFGGNLASLSAPQLGTAVVKAILEKSKIDTSTVDEVILGSVLTSGQGQAPARQVVIHSGLSNATHALTINKVCSSGLKAIMLAADRIRLGDTGAVIGGGMESMSNAPYLLPSMRAGARYGNVAAEDSIIKDGLWDVYNNYLMGIAAELCAKTKNISREEQDTFAIESYNRAINASDKGFFKDEIIPLSVKKGKDDIFIDKDEEPFKANLQKVPSLKPAFQKDGTVTAANASSINDGAAGMIVCSENYAKTNNLTPVAKIRSYDTFGHQPEWFTTAPIEAIKRTVKKSGITLDDVDLFEINEAFSCVAIACQKELNIDHSKLNISGGAVALGHPIGASGSRILVTLIHNLIRLNKKIGVVGICNGGGEATSLVVEKV